MLSHIQYLKYHNDHGTNANAYTYSTAMKKFFNNAYGFKKILM